jgi:imidazole glycerol-phosphate synthase subunit HisF
MYRPRIIPVLLLRNNVLCKSVKFAGYKYIGDPINAVKIFNELKADELIFLDINASREKRTIPVSIIKDIGEEANMPFAVGGGIRTTAQIKQIISAGAEKVIINTFALESPGFINEAANAFGSSTISICMDIKRNFFGKKYLRKYNGKLFKQYSPAGYAKMMENAGAGEIIVQSVDNDGTMKGYDIELLHEISSAVTIPVVAMSGAGNLQHMKEACRGANLNGIAAGSIFIYYDQKKGVLINYPGKSEIRDIFSRD